MSETNNNRKAVYTVIDGTERNPKARWVRIGIAFENRDGSFNLLLDALPVNGKLHVRDFPPSDEADETVGPRPEPPAEAAKRSRTTAVA